MKRNQWVHKIWMAVLFMIVIVASPVRAEAVSQSDQNAYRAVFDAEYYYNTYPDVAAAFGMDENALFTHFVNFGVNEGRSASAEFNPMAYRQRYTDLQAAFGRDMAAYCRHYINYGKAEGRDASTDELYVVVEDTAEQTGNIQSTAQTAQSGTQTTQSVTQTTQSATQATQSVTQASQNTVQTAQTAAQTQEDAGTSQSVVIGTYTTYYEDDVPRASNVELATQRINGVVVQPGESFSFSRTILARTAANGYVEAPIIVSGREEMGIGGGICQVSSTLYAAMVSAGLPATERHAHSKAVDYIPVGLDATIAGNYYDLKFTIFIHSRC